VCYWQARRAQDRALKTLEKFAASPAAPSTRPQYDAMVAAVRDVDARLPTSGPYALECDGLRAASKKRAALAAFQVAVAPTVGKPWRQALFDDCRRLMNESRDGYWRSTKEFLKPTSEPMRRKANLHWLLGQVLSLDVVLGQSLDQSLWTTAHLAAQIDTEASDHVERAWAHVSLAELALLRLSDRSMADDERASVAKDVLSNIERVVDLLGRSSEHVTTTSRQYERYVKWWGAPDLQWALERLDIPERKHWFRKNGLVPTAMEAMAIMRPAGKRGRGSTGEPAPPSQPEGSKDLASPRPSSADPPASKTLARAGRRRKSAAVFDVEMLPAENGDCLWIEYGDPTAPHRFLIDCGAESTAALLTTRVKGLRKRTAPSFELFILTHIDADHINGVVPLLAKGAFDARFQDIWFNGWRQINQFLSVKQAEQFTKLLENPARKLPWNRATSAPRARIPGPLVIPAGKSLPSFELEGGMRLTLLSPGPEQLKRLAIGWEQALAEPAAKVLGRKAPPPTITNFAKFSLEKLLERRQLPDRSAPNGSSIAVLAEFDGRSVLLTGDAHADVLVSSIKRLLKERGGKGKKLKLDAIKLSHHGSANATTTALLDVIDCRRYLVSSNGNIYYHPDREAIARVILHGGRNPALLFNYRSTYNGLWEQPILRKRYEYRTVYPPAGTEGLRVSL
jgi:hypothetical protein